MQEQTNQLPVNDGQTKKPLPTKATANKERGDYEFFKKLKSEGIHLNAQQKGILTSQAQHIVVNALAGTGKTMSLIALTAYQVYIGTPPDSILLLAYSKKASEEMKDRLRRLFPRYNINVCTLHSLCYSLLKANGYSKHTVLSDEYERLGIFNEHMGLIKFDHEYQPEDAALLYSFYKNIMNVPTDTDFKLLFTNYDETKHCNKLLDFNDFLTKAYTLLKSNHALLDHIQSQISIIMVDELNDINLIQYELIRLLCSPKCKLYLFGDPFQSIFGFRGSDPAIFSSIKSAFSEASEKTLNINYRCSGAIIDVANSIINGFNNNVRIKAIKDVGLPVQFIRTSNSIEEARQIVKLIKTGVFGGKKYSDYCVLFRTTTAATAILTELMDSDIPFISLCPIKSVLDNPAAKFIISLLKKVIDDKIPSKPNLLMRIRSETPQNAIRLLVDDTGIQSILYPPDAHKTARDDATESIAKIIELATDMQYVEYFVEYVDKNRNKPKNSSKNAITLSTIHSAKGKEWSTVFIIACVEGVMPHRNVLEPNLLFDKSLPITGSLEEEHPTLGDCVFEAKTSSVYRLDE